jgi:hypothetical protein
MNTNRYKAFSGIFCEVLFPGVAVLWMERRELQLSFLLKTIEVSKSNSIICFRVIIDRVKIKKAGITRYNIL